MFRKNAVLASALAAAATAALTTCGAFAAPSYNITALGTLGGNNSYAYGINDSGQVVGSSVTIPNGGSYAFLWTPGGVNGVSGNPQMQDLGTLGALAGLYSSATAINNSGQVAGDSNGAYANAFLYSGGQMNLLGTMGGGMTRASGINDSGQVVGEALAAGGAYHAVIGTAGGANGNPQIQDLGTLGGRNSNALGINRSGQVVGNSNTISGGAYQVQAFLWTAGGTTGVSGNPQMQNLGTLSGGSSSYAFGINRSGEVVGNSSGSSGLFSYNHAFLYSGGQMTDLGTLGDIHSDSFAYGINDSGQIVGWSRTSNSGHDAFLYSGGVMTDLNSLIPSGSGWTLLNATAINQNGDIVGYGDAPNGDIEAFLLTPVPEPEALALIAIGGMAMLLRRRKHAM